MNRNVKLLREYTHRDVSISKKKEYKLKKQERWNNANSTGSNNNNIDHPSRNKHNGNNRRT